MGKGEADGEKKSGERERERDMGRWRAGGIGGMGLT
jgi:hypothetical protein